MMLESLSVLFLAASTWTRELDELTILLDMIKDLHILELLIAERRGTSELNFLNHVLHIPVDGSLDEEFPAVRTLFLHFLPIKNAVLTKELITLLA
jgi:hypothetical protein